METILTNLPNITALLATVLLPIVFFGMNNRNNRRLKSLEKDLEIKYNDKDDLRKQKKLVYASLSRVLFDVQQLHVSLSGTCVDSNCITNALQKFEVSVNKSHEDISNNMLYLSSEIIDYIYAFYNEIGSLKVKLSEYNSKGEYELAHACVYYSSLKLAAIIMEIQEKFVNEQPEMKINFNKDQQQNMLNCCGISPRKELQEKYLKSIKD